MTFPDGRSSVVTRDEAWEFLNSLRTVLAEELSQMVRASQSNGEGEEEKR